MNVDIGRSRLLGLATAEADEHGEAFVLLRVYWRRHVRFLAAPPNEIIDRAMSTLACAQCGRSLPSDATELARWKYGSLAASGEIDETAAGMLLCPDCAEGDRLGEYEEGEAG